jgi:hypothetical protein
VVHGPPSPSKHPPRAQKPLPLAPASERCLAAWDYVQDNLVCTTTDSIKHYTPESALQALRREEKPMLHRTALGNQDGFLASETSWIGRLMRFRNKQHSIRDLKSASALNDSHYTFWYLWTIYFCHVVHTVLLSYGYFRDTLRLLEVLNGDFNKYGSVVTSQDAIIRQRRFNPITIRDPTAGQLTRATQTARLTTESHTILRCFPRIRNQFESNLTCRLGK